MSRGATLSIMGLYNNDPTVLDMMVFPDGFTDAQKTTTKENILIECAEFEFLYPVPEVAKTIIGIWSRKEKPYWDRVYRASQAEYNPIENYRRNETETVEDIGDLIVGRECRGAGLGRMLVSAVEDAYKGKGYEKITLTTFGFQAPEFYKKLGYEVEFIREDNDPKLRKFFLAKSL